MANVARITAALCRANRATPALYSLSCHATSCPWNTPWNSAAVQHMSSAVQTFEEAKSKLNTLKDDPGNEVKLKLYGLFKQATIGPVNSKRPSVVDFVGRAKWDAWNTLGNMSKGDAEKSYVDLVNSLVAEESGEAASQAATGQKYENFLVSVEDGLRIITLNRPQKLNAITTSMYEEWIATLEEAAADEQTVITALTGSGKYYCAGNDLSNFANIPPEGVQKVAEEGSKLLSRFVASFIDFPKPLVAVVNGPAVGVSVTTMALCDAVYASDKATFHTPFSSLGQSPEGCSSYIFPRMMGHGRATEMLLFNKKITAEEAHRAGLVAEVLPDAVLQDEVWPRLREFAKLPVKSLVYAKALARDLEKDTLHKVNKMECERLVERWTSEDCFNAITSFFSRKNQ